MMLRMYLRWAEAQAMQVEELDHQDGDEAGLRWSTLLISGEYAYGHLKTEEGVHRAVRGARQGRQSGDRGRDLEQVDRVEAPGDGVPAAMR